MWGPWWLDLFDNPPQVLSIKGTEWGDTGSSRDSIVVCKFGHGQDFCPVALLIIHITPQVRLQDGIDTFCLAIGLRVETGRKFLSYTY